MSDRPRAYIDVGAGNYLAVDVPEAEPPEWYAQYLADVESTRLNGTEGWRSNIRQAEDEWLTMKQDSIAEDHTRALAARGKRHDIWA